jgi:histidinol-phosphate aminotransferase
MMVKVLSAEQRRDFLKRGFTRRDFARLAAMAAASAALPFYNEAALAQGLSAMRNIPPDAVLLHANENPMGPCPQALEAVLRTAKNGGRYQFSETFAFIDLMASIEGLKKEYVAAFAGSSDPLHRAVLAFTSPSRSLVVADPGFEAPERAAQFIGAKVIRLPLRKDYAHDVNAMAQADPEAGLIYVCNPNNPTGTVTRKEDVEYLVANKPKGCIVLIDEAYIHLSQGAEPAVPLVASDKDVIILRTFSKLYGMAGLRAGAALARPDLIERLRGYGSGILPPTGMAAAIASLKVKDLVPERRRIVSQIRAETFAWLDRKGFAHLPSDCNMFMVDAGRPGQEVIDAMLKEKVAIGRSWPSMPHHVRVTIGTREEMAKFRQAFERVMNA